MIGNSNMAPYYFRNEEEKKLYLEHYLPTNLTWLETVNQFGSRKLKAHWAKAANIARSGRKVE